MLRETFEQTRAIGQAAADVGAARTAPSVLLALAEFDDIGRSAFLAKYGFGEARS